MSWALYRNNYVIALFYKYKDAKRCMDCLERFNTIDKYTIMEIK
jgi:hypothetical protein